MEMKKFADYFEEAIKYGESLGLRNDTNKDFVVELDSPNPIKRDNGAYFYPGFLAAWEGAGIDVNALSIVKPEFTLEQQLKLIKLFTSAYEQYLADKKEPVAADSAE
jgi:hypothetical protein